MRDFTKLTLFIFIVTMGCRSPMTMVENGNYDRALKFSAKKLAGNKKKNPRHLESLEAAFNLGNERDLERIVSNINLANSNDLKYLLQILDRIEARQNVAKPFVSVSDKNGYVAEFEFIKVEKLRTELHSRLESSLMDELEVQLALARKWKKKEDAQKAYGSMIELLESYPKVESISFLNTMDSMKELGTIRYSLTVNVPESEVFIKTLADEKSLPILFNNNWYKYSLSNPDIHIRYNIFSVNISPERIAEKEYWDQKEIEDGKVALLDDNGEEVIDSLGKVIYIPKVKKIKAKINSISQFKEGSLTGEVIVFSSVSGEIIFKERLDVVTNFENHYAEFRGNKNALKSDTKKLVNHQWIPFPANQFMAQEMIDQAWNRIPSIARKGEYRILKSV